MDIYKCCNIFFSLIFGLIGLAVLGVGLSEYNKDAHAQTFPMILMVAGGAVFVVCVLGLCETLCDSIFITFIYALLTFVVAVASGYAGIILLVRPDVIKEVIVDYLDQFHKDNPLAFHGIEKLMQCCGPRDDTYWIWEIPVSCCPGLKCRTIKGIIFHNPSCDRRITSLIRSYAPMIAFGLIGFAVKEFTSAICGLYYALKSK